MAEIGRPSTLWLARVAHGSMTATSDVCGRLKWSLALEDDCGMLRRVVRGSPAKDDALTATAEAGIECKGCIGKLKVNGWENARMRLPFGVRAIFGGSGGSGTKWKEVL